MVDNSDDESVINESRRRNSVLTPEDKGGKSRMKNFALRKATRRPRFRNKNKMLTKKQVSKLSSLESSQIAYSHTFKELQYILDSLSRLYAQIYQNRDLIKEARKKDEENDKLSKEKVLEIRRERGTLRKKKTQKRKTNKRFFSTIRGKGLRTSTIRGNKQKNKPKAAGIKSKKTRISARRASVLVGDFFKLAARIRNIKTSDDDKIPIDKLKEYNAFEVENALEKTDRAVKTHQRFKEKEKQRWLKWEQEVKADNIDALLKMQKLIPSDLKVRNEESLTQTLDGNKFLARRFVRNKVFLLFNTEFEKLQSIHPADLKSRFHIGNLDIIELRALYAHTEGIKREWRYALRDKLAEMVEKEKKGELTEKERRHPAYSNKPDFDVERKPSVIAFLERKDEPTGEWGRRRQYERAPSLVAKAIQQKFGVEQGSDLDQARKQGKKKEEIDEDEERDADERAASSIYLTKRAPDAPVDLQALSSEKDTNGPRNEKKDLDISDGDSRRARRHRNNIFFDVESERETGLSGYFKQKEKAEKEAQTRKTRFDYNEKEFEVTPDDSLQEMKRKKSELFLKAFEMINSTDVEETDEVFMKTLRQLSCFNEKNLSGSSQLEEVLNKEKFVPDREEESDEDDHAPPNARSIYLNPASTEDEV